MDVTASQNVAILKIIMSRGRGCLMSSIPVMSENAL